MITIGMPGVEKLLERLNEIEKKRLPSAVSNAVNHTARDFRNAMRTGIARRFTLREPDFVLGKEGAGEFGPSDATGAVHIPRGSTWSNRQGRFSATIAVGGGGRRNSSILNKFEAGGERKGDADSIAIPTTVLRPSFSDRVPRAMLPKNLGLKASHQPGRKGKHGTFVIGQMGDKQWGIYKRVGPGKNDIRKIWSFRTRIQIPRRLKFYETAQRFVPNAFMKNMRTALAEALGRSDRP